jgi:POT family proton-dependent oligopeptide transporter
MFVYLLALPGGWLADKLFGLRKSIFYGGCIIALGHFCLAFPFTETFFLGLLLIVAGTGLLKPNISALIGELYPADDPARRDSGFSIFYMGINIGAFISPFITGYLGENVNWHYGFAAAGIGMAIGLVYYKLTEKKLGEAGLRLKLPLNEDEKNRERKLRIGLWCVLVIFVIFIGLLLMRVIYIDPISFARGSGLVLLTCVLVYFIYVFSAEKLDSFERKKIFAICVMFVITTTFYAGFEGQGSSLNLFAERYTDMFVGSFEMPASWMQSVPPIFVVIFVPIFAWLWVWLAKKNMNPSTPVKLSLGLIFLGFGYLVMVGASMIVIEGEKPLPTWLTFTYMFLTFGEICLYPIGLSAVTKLSPSRLVGQMMGVFFMSLALGNLIAGLYAGEFDNESITANPNLLVDLFGLVAKITIIAGIVVLIFSKAIRKLMGDIR